MARVPGRRLVALALGAVLVVAGSAAVYLAARPSAPLPASRSSPAPTPAFSTPVRMVIPSINVDAPVDVVGLDANHDVAVPRDTEHVAWYQGSVMPGDPGNALFDGHMNWYAEPALGRPAGPRVFWALGSLRPGAEVRVVEGNGMVVRFTVDWVREVPEDATANSLGLLSRSGPATITLITCTGAWDTAANTYANRLIAHATA